jgi:hypothetical protein
MMNTETVPNHQTLIADYLAIWNEPDARRRQELITSSLSPAVQYLDPMMQSQGHEGFDAMIQGVQAQFPGHAISLISPIDALGNQLRFSWDLAPVGGDVLLAGTDFCVLAADGRLASITGFLDKLPAQA